MNREYKEGTGKMKKRRWIAIAMSIAAFCSGMVLPAFSAAAARYENRYSSQEDMGIFTVTEGDKENSEFVLNQDPAILPYPDEGGGVAEMRLVKGGSVTDARFVHEFSEPIYTFGAEEKISVEMKVRFTWKGNVKTLLRLDDTVNGVSGEALLEFDDGQINANKVSGRLALAGVKGKEYAYSPDKWYQVFLTLSGNQYDVYFQGKKLNTQSLTLSRGNQKQINRICNSHRTWNNESSYYDDLIIQPLEDLRLDAGSTVMDGDTGVSEKLRKIVLDFNTPLAAETITGITISDIQENALKYTVEADETDMTRVNILLPEGLALDSTYTVSYGGLTDLLGSTIDGSMSFSTRGTPSAAVAQNTFPESGAENVSLNSTVTFTFDKKLDPSGIAEAVVAVDPAVPVQSVELADPYTVAVTFAKPFKPNRSYTVGLSGGVFDLEDGLEAKSAYTTFTTALTENMTVDEFEFKGQGFIPELVGITDGTGKVVKPETIDAGNLKIGIESTNPQNYDGDTSRIFLGSSVDDTRLIYHIEAGVRDAVLAVYHNGQPSTAGAIYDLEFAAAETLTDLNSADTLIDITEQVEKIRLPVPPKDGFSSYSYVYRAGEKTYPYFVVRMRRKMKDFAWTPKLANIKFNSLLPDPAAVRTLEDTDMIALESADPAIVAFTGKLDEESLSPEKFFINGKRVTAAVAEGDGTRVRLIPAEPLSYSSVCTVEVKTGLLDLYGREVMGGTYRGLTPHTAAILTAELTEGAQLPEFGEVTPKVKILCRKPGTAVVVYAAYYVGNQMKALQCKRIQPDTFGEQEVILPKLKITHGISDGRVKIFAVADGGRPLPGGVTVGTEHYRH